MESVVRALVLLPQLPHLDRERDQLRRQLAEGQVELAQLREAARRLTRYEQLAEAMPQFTTRVLSIISASPVPSQDVFVVDQGRRQGLRDGLPVLSEQGLAGRLVRVGPEASLVMLLTDPEHRISALVERSRTLGLLEGTGGPLCRLVNLNADDDVVEGDQVVTAGLNTLVPKGLPLGVVTRIERHPEGGSAVAWVKPAVNVHQVEELVCLLSSSSAAPSSSPAR